MAGNVISGFTVPLTPEEEEALEKEKEENEVGFDPLRAAALSAGGSLLRNSGYRNTPMSLGEGIGHAIPAGMQAYYNQDAMNQNEQQALLERQQAEEQALLDKQGVEDAANLKAEEAAGFEAMLKLAFPHDRATQGRYLNYYKTNPLEAHKAVDKLLEPKDKGEVTYEKGKGPDGGLGYWAMPKLGGKPTFTGVLSGDVSKEEEFLFEKFKFGKEIDLETKKFSLTELAQTNLNDYRQKELTRKEGEHDQDYALRLKQHDHNVIQAMVRNDFTDTQIVNQAEQFRMSYDKDNDHFGKGQDLKLIIHNAKMDNWGKKFNEELKVNGQNHQLASDKLEQQIIQDGINNKFTGEKIANQVNQFRGKQSLSEKGLELKQNIFTQQVETDRLNYEEGIRKFNSSLSNQQMEHQDRVGIQTRAQDQSIVEHLALIHQRGVENGFDEDKIALAQEEFINSKGQFREVQDLNVLKYRADVENKAANLAQNITEFSYSKGRDAKGDIRKDDAWEKELKEYEDNLIQQTFDNFQKIQGFDLKKEIFKADIELRKLKMATEGNKPPRTLTGQAAIDWAKEQGDNSPLNENSTGTPVIKLNKYGEFDSIEYLSKKDYDQNQLSHMTTQSGKWSTDTEVKAANKIARLATSLKALADDETGVSEFAMIYKFMKSLDETSTVLASEFRNAAGAGLGAYDRLMLWGDNQYTGAKLTEEQQVHILQAVRGIAHSRLSGMEKKRAVYLELADKNNISKEDAEKLFPNDLQQYFKNDPYVIDGNSVVADIAAASPEGAAVAKRQTYEEYLKSKKE